MSQETESKNLPASNIKLKRQREKGKIAKSADLYAATSVVVGFLFLLLFSAYWVSQITDMFDVSSQSVLYSWEEGYAAVTQTVAYKLLILSSPLAVTLTFAVFLANIIYNKGVIFSFDPVKPNFDRLNPMTGLKRLFGRRAMIEGAQKVVKLLIWFAVVITILWGLMNMLFNASLCGEACTSAVGLILAQRLIVAAIIMFLIIALLDMPLQQAMFLHEMKMGRSERKREDKDQHGSPEVRSQRRRAHREVFTAKGATRVENSSLIISGEDGAVGILYDSNTVSVPIIVAHAQQDKLAQFMEVAQGRNIPSVFDDDLTKKLLKVTIGSQVPKALFDKVAMAMVRAGKV